MNGKTEYGEVQFFFIPNPDPDSELDSETASEEEDINPYALVYLYGPPDADLLEDSSHTLWACEYLPTNIQVVEVTDITAVISMQPLPKAPGDDPAKDLLFVVEKSGLEDTELTGYV